MTPPPGYGHLMYPYLQNTGMFAQIPPVLDLDKQMFLLIYASML